MPSPIYCPKLLWFVAGAVLALLPIPAQTEDLILVSGRGSSGWRYTGEFPSAAPPARQERAWHVLEYDDSDWKEGASPFGFQAKKTFPPSLRVTAWEDSGDYYLRKRFDLPTGISSQSGYWLRLKTAAEDYTHVYLNGQLINRDPHESGRTFTYWNRFERVDVGLLKSKGNVLAVRLGNRPDNVKAYFDLELALEKKADALPPVSQQHGEPLFSYVTIADPQRGTDNPDLQRAVQQINQHEPLFVLALGDITGGGRKESFRATRDILAKLDMPLHIIAGNHDVDTHPIEVYESYFGKSYHRFEYEGCVFICLNTAMHKQHHGGIGGQQMSWLQEELNKAKAARHVFVCGHHNIEEIREARGLLVGLFRQHRVTAYLHGHVHRQAPKQGYQDFPALCCPSVSAWNWWMAGKSPQSNEPTLYPLGYQMNHVYPDKLVSEFHYLGGGVDDDYRYTFLNPRR